MELFFKFALLTILNMHAADWGTKFTSVKASNYVSLSILTLICALLVVFSGLYFIYPRAERIIKYQGVVGPLLAGTDIKNFEQKKVLLFYPVIFFLRRILFVTIVIVVRNIFWVQVASLNFMALGIIIFVMWSRPLETKQLNFFETFNECTLLVMTYHLWCFSDFIKEPETRNQLGFVFISVSLGNIAVHLITMFI